ncbi:RNA polymerase sigma-70 factor [Streptomyces sp. AJS327]|uniref:RNA polymerase sigma-70 factor n=1 Tax=Streptomyces sp. AJS327 TaxID=2545265 RepID=UPI0015DD6A0D|nr:RNA polymerase sigma-70 factor [Streptomyces sp. AJS327]MBA0051152.1 RNA polymerase sigma-70 factor [Streptomyces sp. AJS327]
MADTSTGHDDAVRPGPGPGAATPAPHAAQPGPGWAADAAAGPGGEAAARLFEDQRGLLFGVAYRMLGRVADAEDVVQETWLRWAGAERQDVREPRAYLVRITTRLAVDRLRQLNARRESYVGPWLPEPLPTDVWNAPVPDGARRVELAESVSLAVLVVLESLSPLERAVFVLREAFGFPHAEIATVLERSEAAVRQLAGRARRHVDERAPRFDVDPARQRDLTERFLAAATGGDLRGLLDLLADDARLAGDGGGRSKAPLREIVSADKIGRFLAAVGGTAAAQATFALTEVNGAVAVLAARDGVPTHVMVLGVRDDRVSHVYLLLNPDKLGHLAPAPK